MKPMSPIHVIGIGLDGASGLSASSRIIVEQTKLLVGSTRHLGYFPEYAGERLTLGSLSQAIAHIRQFLTPVDASSPTAEVQSFNLLNSTSIPDSTVAVLTSGDPLFFGLGRLLLMEFPPEWLTFHPHLSSIQLAFSRVKLPWQDAQIISAHGRSLDELTQALQQRVEKIAVLTDDIHSPGAIAELLAALDLPQSYQMWICENLGGTDEKIHHIQDFAALPQHFAPLNVVVLQRQVNQRSLTQPLPMLGIQDQDFLSFRDRPGLMTKREIRILVLGELALQPQQTIWDIGAGTGSVSIEIARLCPASQVFSVEKTAAGIALLQQNCQRFQVENVTAICGAAPEALQNLPAPDRVFIGGSGGNLSSILEVCANRLALDGRLVLALATLEHLNTALTWFEQTRDYQWSKHLVQIQISRSVPVASLTRMAPLNPVTLVIFERTRISKKL